jgi:hypothetical protein
MSLTVVGNGEALHAARPDGAASVGDVLNTAVEANRVGDIDTGDLQLGLGYIRSYLPGLYLSAVFLYISTYVLTVQPRVRSLELLASVGDELLEDAVGVAACQRMSCFGTNRRP